MKITSIKTTLAAIALAAVILPGCKKFLDVNDNPNATEKVDPEQILPSAQAAVMHVINSQYQTFGNFWAQYWTQLPNSSQFRSVEQYSSGPADFDRAWGILYAGALTDTDSLIVKQNQARYAQYAAIGWILRAYSFQLLTDGFGDVPLKDALMGTANRSPRYDTQQEVYDSVFSFIDHGLALMDPDSDYHPGDDDLLAGGDMETWIRIANTLKLRAYLRLTEVDAAKAQAGVEALYSDGALFLEDDVTLAYTSQGGNQNPLWAEVVALNTRNQGASSTIMDPLKANDDPRITRFYQLRVDSTTYRSTPQGTFDQIASNIALSYPNSATVLGPTAPGVLMSAAESYFLQAEAAQRGWGSGNAAELYRDGIRASFAFLGLEDDEATTYINSAPAAQWPANPADRIGAIITQKWFAMCGSQGFEAWTEYRRTGYPDWIEPSAASILGPGNMAQRFVYPQTELTRNGNFPGLKPIGERVWWDTK
ncbi:SusD/RagB family nutrient-binding outer membrane lipoprotein [Chitinophaga cymbidii]|uniref:SusD/RagB family nutrient-binding outer membrane lipoprotein n=1 Tax=Chitinophaga cymbidii TaxID=1096750 RepID=A0A512RI47_9BACT|nr:SusD/RagB family nutrient-binding outer membrane lipoprotein [Chitinophaga cymbidii]GEP95365.1 hypothetical protein CCY01nite_16250 [Chitinophaga cymbidii]